MQYAERDAHSGYAQHTTILRRETALQHERYLSAQAILRTAKVN
jgi:uncharacterized protein YqgQ